ncbi:N-acetylmuramate alpha-1-phosphate uridylyltransferase MurU [Pleionea sediminis]|uniref:N-acetylmuramate alpha-1-phosphate uridylyltransferase MurU n=1 Tax=Pleionea sediminis TaxID=2569479 RepID=UPI0011851810|nr:nucleotidyltransferase family protein [Pleionea sediminis]
MKAFILAAGLGTRMRPLTNNTPKPLLKIGSKPIIHYPIEKLKQAGIESIVINTAYLGQLIKDALGDGSRFGVNIAYSDEGEPLETGGAIRHALPLLGDEPFILVNGDIYTDFPFENLLGKCPEVAHLVLVENPSFKEVGDFGICGSRLTNDLSQSFTYSGIGVYNPAFFQRYAAGSSFPLGPVLREQAEQQLVSAEVYRGCWMDIGTPERLHQINELLA